MKLNRAIAFLGILLSCALPINALASGHSGKPVAGGLNPKFVMRKGVTYDQRIVRSSLQSIGITTVPLPYRAFAEVDYGNLHIVVLTKKGEPHRTIDDLSWPRAAVIYIRIRNVNNIAKLSADAAGLYGMATCGYNTALSEDSSGYDCSNNAMSTGNVYKKSCHHHGFNSEEYYIESKICTYRKRDKVKIVASQKVTFWRDTEPVAIAAYASSASAIDAPVKHLINEIHRYRKHPAK